MPPKPKTSASTTPTPTTQIPTGERSREKSREKSNEKSRERSTERDKPSPSSNNTASPATNQRSRQESGGLPTTPLTPRATKKKVQIHPEAEVETFEEEEATISTKSAPLKKVATKENPTPVVETSPVAPAPAIISTDSMEKKPTITTTPTNASSPKKSPKKVAVKEKKKPKNYRDEAAIAADNDELEREITTHLGQNVALLRLKNSFIIFPERNDYVLYQTIVHNIESNPSSKKTDLYDLFASHGAKTDADAIIRLALNEPLDVILTYHKTLATVEQQKARYEFIKSLLAQKFILTLETGTRHPRMERVLRLVCPFEKLTAQAEHVKLKMPLKKSVVEKYIKDFEKKQVTPKSRLLALASRTYLYAKECKQKRSAPFERSKIKDFEGGDFANSEVLKCHFFTPAQRNFIIHTILKGVEVSNYYPEPNAPAKVTIDNHKRKWGFLDLVHHRIFLEVQPIHGKESIEVISKDRFYSLPSSKTLRYYLGEKWAFYFAFVEFFKEFCFRLFFFGAGMVAVSALIYALPSSNSAVSNSTFGLMAGFLKLFDNAAIPAYAFVANVAGLLFLKFWKRRRNCLAFLWDTYNPITDEEERPEWKPSSKLDYSYTSGEMVTYESHGSRFMRHVVSSLLLVLCFVVIIGTVAVDVVLYSYISNQSFFGTDVGSSYGLVGALGIVAVFASVHLLLVEWVSTRASIGITYYENHRKCQSYLTRFISINFFLQFFNSFGLLLFMMLARPMMAQSNSFSYYYGTLICKAQGSGDTCLQEMAVLVFLMFFVQEFLYLLLSGLSFIFKRAQYHHAVKHGKTAFEKYQKLNSFGEEGIDILIQDKIMQFGSLLLFAAAFPLGPFLAIINNYLQVRLTIKKVFLQYKRTWALPSDGIGAWEGALTFLVYLSIAVNGLSIPYISDGFYYISNYFYTNNYVAANYQYTQVGFFLVYSFVFVLIASGIHFLIADQPKQVLIGMKAEKHIAKLRSQF